MDKRTELNARLKQAMMEKDQVALSTVRLIMAALKDKDIQARTAGKGEGIEDSEILALYQSMIKQRQESIAIYRESNREDLAQREEAEVRILNEFLPVQLTDSELEDAIVSLIGETGASTIKDMGKVIGLLKQRYAGQTDMARASAKVKEKLG